MELIPLNDVELVKHGIPIKKSTFYYWHHRGKHAEIFCKIGKRLFLVKDEWQKLVEKNIGK